MGVVWHADDGASGGHVAIKVLATTERDQVERALREAGALARLQHDAIVRYVAHGVLADGRVYLVMEWLDGPTVAIRALSEGFSLADAVVTTRRVAGALAAAHAAQIVHRDVKPSNVLLPGGDATRAMLIDFGVARVGGAAFALTKTGAAVGTPGYMSPEQARGERDLGAAADVFGLGCVLYECATGRPAFSGSIAAAVLAKILFAQPAPITLACPDAPPELVALLARMLAKDRTARVQSCDEVVAALDALPPLQGGTKRSSRALVVEPTKVHAVVAAAPGIPEDANEPPSDETRQTLAGAAARIGVALEVLATGAVVAHAEGDAGEVADKAQAFARELGAALPAWSVAVSEPAAEVGVAVERGATALTNTALQAIFKKRRK
jgi:serine/threonine protein kinase